jgi:hypothetical protein
MFVDGTLQLSNTNSQVFEPRIPNLSNFGEVENPGIPLRLQEILRIRLVLFLPRKQ